MSAQQFTSGKLIEWRDESFLIRQLLADNQVELENIHTGKTHLAKINALTWDLYNGLLNFVREDKRNKPHKKEKSPREIECAELSDYRQALQDAAHFRKWVIDPLLDLKPRKRQAVEDRVNNVNQTIEIVRATYLGAQKISVASVYRWIGDFERSGRDIRSLVPNTDDRGGKEQWRIDPEVEAIVNAVIQDKYLTRERTTFDDLLHEVAVRIDDENRTRPKEELLSCPDRTTIIRRTEALDVRQIFEIKHGKRAADRQFSQFHKGPEPDSPLECAEIDHTRIDTIVVDDEDNLPLGRATFTDCLDVCTRYPLGYYLGFEPPSYYSVMECLYRAIWLKEDVQAKYGLEHAWRAYGVIQKLVTDRGKEFIGPDLEDSCLSLNIVLEQMPIKKPHFKGKIERLFRTSGVVIHSMPGTTFSSVGQRGDYDSAKNACMYLSEVDEILTRFLVDVYAERKHRGLDGIPARRWEQALERGFLPRVPASAHELSILLGKVDWRTVQPYGIEYECLTYNAPELALLRNELKKGQDVKIKIHPGDISRIYVHNPFTKMYIEAPAEDPYGYTAGLSLWKHRVIHRFAKDQQEKRGEQVDLTALGRAKRAIQSLVDDAKLRKHQVKTRTTIARWEESGHTPSLADKQLTGDIMQSLARPTLALLPQPPVIDLSPNQPANECDWSLTFDRPVQHIGVERKE